MPNLSTLNLPSGPSIPVKGVSTPLQPASKAFSLGDTGRVNLTAAAKAQTEAEIADKNPVKFTFAELGQQLKAEKPGLFDSFTDDEVGQKMVERKPELAQYVVRPEEKSGFIANLVKGVASPFLRVLAGPAQLLAGSPTVRNMKADSYGLDAEGNYVGSRSNKGIDLPYFGNIQPVGYDEQGQMKSVGGVAKDVLGTGLEIGSYFTGAGEAGALAKGAATTVAKGAAKQGLKSLAIQGAKEGALIGATGSLGAGLQDQDATVGDLLGRTAMGGALGAGLGASVPALAEGALKTARYSKELYSGIKTNVRELTAGARETLSGVETPTLNVLDPSRKIPQEVINAAIKEEKAIPRAISLESQAKINADLENYITKAKRAAADPRLETPLEYAGGKASDAVKVYNDKLEKWGVIKQKALGAVGNKMMDVGSSKKLLIDKMREILGAEFTPFGIANVPGRVSSISLDVADQRLLADVANLLGNLDDSDSLFRVDGTVDAIQDILYKRSQNVMQPVNSKVEGMLKYVVGDLNGRLKKTAGSTYTKANDKYSYFINTRDLLNKAVGYEGSKGGSLMKRVFSPTDGGTKALFAKIKKDTGIDLVKEATLAKVAMEFAGDTRQRSLLESLDLLSPGSSIKNKLFEKAINMVKNKYANPLDVLRSASKGTKLK